ncbi:hypothetical protein D9615_007814 [Tricholomella constricta]|uniref:HNH nuclease domain-containing protein n=1 Tax=Tricholomella constricta TaxID=117010 RepID=A0A8H5H4J1_9AGAR|nr:hypothetical protein D9615_007814 [Tricholomella constricta]
MNIESADSPSNATPSQPISTPIIPASQWDLHLAVTRTWGNRTLSVQSTEWRRLRSQVLIRDNGTCASCQYTSLHPMGRGMKIDHQDGDASNNDPLNLRVHCPPCEAIRHCGLHGRKGYLYLAKSDMEQVEIIRRTREMFEASGRMPRVREVEPQASPVDISIVDFANLLLETDWDDLQEKKKRFRGFFTPRAKELFSVTMAQGYGVFAPNLEHSCLRSRANRNEDGPSPADLQAMQILHLESSLPWIRFSPEVHETLPKFLDSWPPSSTKQSEVAWICVSNSRIHPTNQHPPDIPALCRAWDQLCTDNRASIPELDRLASQFRVLSGKWLIFVPTSSVDALWSRIARSTHAGTLGSSAKVSPYDDIDSSTRHLICVFTRDYKDQVEVNRVQFMRRTDGTLPPHVIMVDAYAAFFEYAFMSN